MELSKQFPLPLIETAMPASRSICWYAPEQYWLPRSECCTRPGGGLRITRARCSAAMGSSFFSRSLTAQPTIRREYRSTTMAR
jgi:hypothetical protein